MANTYKITKSQWAKYIGLLRQVQDVAADEMLEFMKLPRIQALTGVEYSEALISYGYALATKYGEGATAIVCGWYDAIAMAEGIDLLPAVPAETATMEEIAMDINGVRRTTNNPNVVSGVVGRAVKTAGVDTLIKNALRDGAEWAWIPVGETCAFCLTLASRGWQTASKKAIKNGHASHIHSNCDCTYAVRHTPGLEVEGYDPGKYLNMYQRAEGANSKEKINFMRREFYWENKEKINEQKRAAYALKKDMEETEA